jgi:hypothetical protein
MLLLLRAIYGRAKTVVLGCCRTLVCFIHYCSATPLPHLKNMDIKDTTLQYLGCGGVVLQIRPQFLRHSVFMCLDSNMESAQLFNSPPPPKPSENDIGREGTSDGTTTLPKNPEPEFLNV